MSQSLNLSQRKPLEFMNAYILTGGKSTRMKRDKALLTLGGRTFLDIVAGCTAPLFDRVYTVGKEYLHGLIAGNIEDRIEGAGPLAGIHAALLASDKECNFFTCIDYPLLSPEIILELARFARTGKNRFQCVVPIAPDGPHPLFAFYCKRCIPGVERCLREGSHQVLCIARYSRVRLVRLPDEIPTIGSDRIERVFSNVNCKGDYDRVKNIFKKS